MQIQPNGNNQTILHLRNGTSVLFSYSTPVAAFIAGRGYVQTNRKYSQTTSRHIRAFAGNAEMVEQSEIDALVNNE